MAIATGTVEAYYQTPGTAHKHLDSAHGCHSGSFAHETFHCSWKIPLGQTALSLAILPKWAIKNQNQSLALALAKGLRIKPQATKSTKHKPWWAHDQKRCCWRIFDIFLVGIHQNISKCSLGCFKSLTDADWKGSKTKYPTVNLNIIQIKRGHLANSFTQLWWFSALRWIE